MKRKILGAATILVAIVAVAMTPIEELNKAVKGILAKYNNSVTVTELVFTDLEVDSVRATKAGVKANYVKKGTLTDITFSVPEISYDIDSNGNGPVAKFNLDMATDLQAILGQEIINQMGPAVSDIISNMASGFLEAYGDAAQADIRTIDESYDGDGNLISIKVAGDLKLDFSKLPVEITPKEVPLRSMQMTLAAGLKGLSVTGVLNLNRDYEGFDEDQEGLKELIEKLLQQDPELLAQIQEAFGRIDEVLTKAANEGFQDGSGDDGDEDDEVQVSGN